LLYDYPENQFFSGNKRRIDMLNLPATQVEAIAFSQPYTGLITSEGHVLFSQTAFGIQIRDWVSPSPSFVENNPDKHFDFRLSPNPATGNKVFVDITGAAHKELVLNVYDSSGKQLVQPEHVVKHTNEGENRVKLKINHLKPGLYFVRLSCDGYQVEKKLMVQ
ncbi:MAG: T9SS type A sorting domain-containing protein, partial [Bacteroidetes bacterium]|nr:T9SS type A sorting domain-containing protein [Bacteroidota bacterium]